MSDEQYRKFLEEMFNEHNEEETHNEEEQFTAPFILQVFMSGQIGMFGVCVN